MNLIEDNPYPDDDPDAGMGVIVWLAICVIGLLVWLV